MSELSELAGHHPKVEIARRDVIGLAVKMAMLAATIVALGGGALWNVAHGFSVRPTHTEMEAFFQTHAKQGHKETNDEIRAIREEQIRHGILLDRMEKALAEHTLKLEELLNSKNHRN